MSTQTKSTLRKKLLFSGLLVLASLLMLQGCQTFRPDSAGMRSQSNASSAGERQQVRERDQDCFLGWFGCPNT
ncbi:MAG: hypothetical protein ACO4AU_12535 [bacterium]|jgi:uncharacterized lipoprotein YajG